MTSYISSAKEVAMYPLGVAQYIGENAFEVWNKAAQSAPFMFKAIDFGNSLNTLFGTSALLGKYLPNNQVFSHFATFAAWSKPVTVMFKGGFDAVERGHELWKNGGDLLDKAWHFKGPIHKNVPLHKLMTRVAMVAGLCLWLPIYLSNTGAISLGILTRNVGIVGPFRLIDLVQFTLVTIGTVYGLYEKFSANTLVEKDTALKDARARKQMWEICEKVRAGVEDQHTVDDLKNNYRKASHKLADHNLHMNAAAVNGIWDKFTTIPQPQVEQQIQLAARALKMAELEGTKEKSGTLDDITKAMIYFVSVTNAYVTPVSHLIACVALDCFNKGASATKAFIEAKRRDLVIDNTKWLNDIPIHHRPKKLDKPNEYQEAKSLCAQLPHMA